jgi:hypothetical protein
MPKLSNILNDSDEIKIPTNAGDITIQYYPSRVTQKMASQLRAFSKLANKEDADEQELQEALHKVFGLLLGLIESWDLEDEVPCGQCEGCRYHLGGVENGAGGEDKDLAECTAKKTVSFPLDADRLNDLPVWLIGEIAEGITDPNQGAPRRKRKRN